MAEDENGESIEPPNREQRDLYDMYLQADEEGRETLKGLFALAGLPVPFTLPPPPENVTPQMAIAALRTLIAKSQALARENARVMLGISQIDEQLGNKMLVDAHLTQGRYQDLLKEIITELQGKGSPS